MLYDFFDSPIGKLMLSTDGAAITRLSILREDSPKEWPLDWVWRPAEVLLQEGRRELDEYFAGCRDQFELPLSMPGTDFQKRVWRELVEVPFGSTITYAAIAGRLGNPNAARAVGAAVARNPICIMIPCHRVVGSDGALRGFLGGVENKRQLLSLEHIKPTR